MFLNSILMLAQVETRYTPPSYFLPVAALMLVAGMVLWLVAAVLGFARARAFGPSTRWFAIGAVCMIIYHLQFLLLAVGLIVESESYTPNRCVFQSLCGCFGAVLDNGLHPIDTHPLTFN